ncbi:MAG: SUMF1/EgtB/PvdO family nonheme iron enzyme [Acidobacteriota bacterium]
MYCERCNVEFPESLRYCKWCGEALIERVRATGDLPSCPHCGEGIKVGWAFCRSCGMRLTASVQAIPVCQHCGAVVDTAAGVCKQCGRNVAGAIVYKQESAAPHQAEHCPACGEKLDTGVLYCKGCGSPVYSGTAPFGAVAVTCRICDAYNPAGSTSCRVCGESLIEPVTKEYDRPVKSAPPTLVDTTDLPDALPFVEDLNKKDAAASEPVPQSVEPEQPVREIFSITPSGKLTSMKTQIIGESAEISSAPPTAGVQSETIEFASETLDMQPETVPINERPKGGAQTTILHEPVVSEEEPPVKRDKPTTRIDGSPFEFELESTEAAPEGYPSRLDEPLSDVIGRTEKKPDATIQFGAVPTAEEPAARSGDTIIVGSPQEPVFTIEERESVEAESQSEPVFVIEQRQETLVIESQPEPVFVIEQRQEMPFVLESPEPASEQPPVESAATIDLNQSALQSQPTIPIRQDDVATMSLSSQEAQSARPPEAQVQLNEATLQAFGMGAPKEQPLPPPPPPPTAYVPTRASDFHIPVMMPAPPTRSRSLVPMVSTLVALVVLAATALALWWYVSGGLKTSKKETISLPPPPENTSAPPTENTAPAAPAGMAMVAAGQYTIGRDLGDELERPAHKVELKAFYIDLTEVTNAAYKQFIDATNHRQPDGWKNGTYPEGRANWPVTGISWQDAVDYAEWAGKRLPTEAEWEAAARGLEGRIYPWGNAWGEGMANIRASSIVEVGQFKLGASPVGALDMIGNVWEWTADPFKVYPGGTASLEGLLEPGITYKVIRGGAFDRKENIEATYRGFLDASKGYDKTGFRCVKEIK